MSTSPMSNTPNSSPTMLTPNPWMPMLTPSPWMQQSVCVRCAVHSEHEDSEFGRVYSCSCLDKKNPRTMKLLDSEALARIWATPTPTPTPARCEAIYLSRRDRSRSNVDRTEDLLLRMDENEELWGIPSRASEIRQRIRQQQVMTPPVSPNTPASSRGPSPPSGPSRPLNPLARDFVARPVFARPVFDLRALPESATHFSNPEAEEFQRSERRRYG